MTLDEARVHGWNSDVWLNIEGEFEHAVRWEDRPSEAPTALSARVTRTGRAHVLQANLPGPPQYADDEDEDAGVTYPYEYRDIGALPEVLVEVHSADGRVAGKFTTILGSRFCGLPDLATAELAQLSEAQGRYVVLRGNGADLRGNLEFESMPGYSYALAVELRLARHNPDTPRLELVLYLRGTPLPHTDGSAGSWSPTHVQHRYALPTDGCRASQVPHPEPLLGYCSTPLFGGDQCCVTPYQVEVAEICRTTPDDRRCPRAPMPRCYDDADGGTYDDDAGK